MVNVKLGQQSSNWGQRGWFSGREGGGGGEGRRGEKREKKMNERKIAMNSPPELWSSLNF